MRSSAEKVSRIAATIGAPERLVELCGATARPVITLAAKADTSGRAIQMLGALAQLAQAHENLAAAAAFNQEAVEINAKNDASVISADLLVQLQPFADKKVFYASGAALVAQAKFQKAKFGEASELKIKTILVRVASALGALVAVSAPASFDVIFDCSFCGQPDPARARKRPTLFSKKYGNLETPLNSLIRDLIDEFFFCFLAAFGFPPRSLLAGKDGQLRFSP